MSLDPEMLILIIDDLPIVRRIMKQSLSLLGFTQLTEAENGTEALAKLKEADYQLIISDWHMPGMSGIDLLRAVRKDVMLKDIPFLMCSSRMEKVEIEEAGIAGVTNYLGKPFTTAMLADKLKSIFTKNVK